MVVWKKVRATTIFQTEAATGRTNAHMLFMSPRFLTSRYVGTIPPLKNIVNRMRPMNNWRPTKSDLLSAYEAGRVTARLSRVPTTV
ncbi:hypothetical protein D3C74_377470 [compost metagenome]